MVLLPLLAAPKIFSAAQTGLTRISEGTKGTISEVTGNLAAAAESTEQTAKTGTVALGIIAGLYLIGKFA